MKWKTPLLLAAAALGLCPPSSGSAGTAPFSGVDLAIVGGRVIDPESGLDAVRNVGIRGSHIVAVTSKPLRGRTTVNARGLVVAPGFIDLHAHGLELAESQLKAQDGVTTHLELEIGVHPVGAWYEAHLGRSAINYGASAGHIFARILTFTRFTSADLTRPETWPDQVMAVRSWADAAPDASALSKLKDVIQDDLNEGALGIGYGINYTPGASREEILELFKLAARNGVTNFVHARYMGSAEPGGSVDALQELVADAASARAAVHVMHIGSTGGREVPVLLRMIDAAREHGIDVSTEVYPYTAYSTAIGAAIFDGDFTRAQGISYSDIELAATGERFTRERFDEVRRTQPGAAIIGHAMRDADIDMAVAHPGVMIASDGSKYVAGRAHPRSAGTFARFLGRYVREKHLVGLADAISRITYLPARRLEAAVPQMRLKGRIKVGADADITIFDAGRVLDRATYAEPARPSAGIVHVIVNGAFVVRDEHLLADAWPGLPIRRPLQRPQGK